MYAMYGNIYHQYTINIPSIYPLYVSKYTSTMDPMGDNPDNNNLVIRSEHSFPYPGPHGAPKPTGKPHRRSVAGPPARPPMAGQVSYKILQIWLILRS